MDVRYINPFLHGTGEVLIKMSSLMVKAGKPFAKKSDIAPGDISGIIGITGDAVGSLAISFTESCICSIVTGMLGELHLEINKDVIDAVGELTNMISGAARSRLEREGLILHAAIPTVVFGKQHTLKHVFNSPSIVIPFQTEGGFFYLDVCLKMVGKQTAVNRSKGPADHYEARQPEPNVLNLRRKPASSHPDSAPHQWRPSPLHQPDSLPSPAESPGQNETHMSGAQAENQEPAVRQTPPRTLEERLEALSKAIDNTNEKREEALDVLKRNPFLPLNERKKYNKIVESCDAAIKRLKLDISAARTIAEIKDGETQIKNHYQHHGNSSKKRY